MVNKCYHNYDVLIDMLYYGFPCVQWENKIELIFKITDRKLFEEKWTYLTGKKMSYDNITRGLRKNKECGRAFFITTSKHRTFQFGPDCVRYSEWLRLIKSGRDYSQSYVHKSLSNRFSEHLNQTPMNDTTQINLFEDAQSNSWLNDFISDNVMTGNNNQDNDYPSEVTENNAINQNNEILEDRSQLNQNQMIHSKSFDFFAQNKELKDFNSIPELLFEAKNNNSFSNHDDEIVNDDLSEFGYNYFNDDNLQTAAVPYSVKVSESTELSNMILPAQMMNIPDNIHKDPPKDVNTSFGFHFFDKQFDISMINPTIMPMDDSLMDHCIKDSNQELYQHQPRIFDKYLPNCKYNLKNFENKSVTHQMNCETTLLMN